MNASLMLAFELAAWLPTLPLFDWNAAWIVGLIVAVGAVVVIAVAIATPVVAIQGGATRFGTAFTVTCIGLVTGSIAGAAAGFYWGHEGAIKREKEVQYVLKVSNQIDVYCEVDPRATGSVKQAKNLECVVVRYDAEGLESKVPGIAPKEIKLKALDMETFTAALEDQLKAWLKTRPKNEHSPIKPRIHLFMVPYPGNTLREKLATFCANHGCVLETTDSEYISALKR